MAIIESDRRLLKLQRLSYCIAAIMALPWCVCVARYQVWAWGQRSGNPLVRVTPYGYAYHEGYHYERQGRMVSLFDAEITDGRSACLVCCPPWQEFSGQPESCPRWLALLAPLSFFVFGWGWGLPSRASIEQERRIGLHKVKR